MNDLDVFGKAEEKGRPAFGIDLGTTNSAISVCTVNEFVETISLNRTSRKTIPSCVQWNGVPGEFVVGVEAYKNRAQKNVIYSVKTLMQNPDATVTFEYGDKKLTMTPAEVSAEILKALVRQTDGIYGEVKDVVVTVPAYFMIEGVEATKKACELAGLNLLGILREPTSASMCCKLDAGSTQDVLIYDLGGGTFDVSLIHIADDSGSSELDDLYGFDDAPVTEKVSDSKSIQVIDTSGDAHLGGDDYDKEIYHLFLKKLHAIHDFKDSDIPVEERENMILQLESFKKASVEDVYSIYYDFHLVDGEIKGHVDFGPLDFVEAFVPIFDRTMKKVMEVIQRAPKQYKPEQIVLVGGSTKNPILKEMLRSSFPSVTINDSYNPDESVARGAAIQAKRLKFGSGSVKVFDIVPIGIGIKVESDNGPIVKSVIKRGTRLPFSTSSFFSTTMDNQKVIEVEVYQGDSISVPSCSKLGDVVIDKLKPAKAGEKTVVVKLSINADSILSCHVLMDGEEREKKISLAAGKGKSDTRTKEERNVERWKNTAATFGEADRMQLLYLIGKYPEQVDWATIVDFINRTMAKQGK